MYDFEDDGKIIFYFIQPNWFKILSYSELDKTASVTFKLFQGISSDIPSLFCTGSYVSYPTNNS